MIKFIYKWLPICFGCHGMPSRSFYIKGKKFPICSRCTGELVGIIISFCFYKVYKFKIITLIIFMIPMILDGGVQLVTNYESNNTKRFLTGFLFGYSLGSLFLRSTIYMFLLGRKIGLAYK